MADSTPSTNIFATDRFKELVRKKSQEEELRYRAQASVDQVEAYANAVGTLYGVCAFFLKAGNREALLQLLKDALKNARKAPF